jgi:hypothetical protein
MGKKGIQNLPSLLKDDRVGEYINKCVDFSYHGIKLKFYLSHGLFSSNDIDAGTRLLLKTLAQKTDFTAVSTVLDMGCGTGVIGVSLKKRHPHLLLRCTDRDALALAFTEENAVLNKVEGIVTEGCLGVETGGEKYDLVVTNIPAKMGEPVMEDMTARSLASLKPGGTFACVVIPAFKEIIRGAALKNNGTIRFCEETSRHTVYHIQAESAPAPQGDPFAPYERSSREFSFKVTGYRLTTVFNLPDFDTIGYGTAQAMALVRGLPAARRLLVVNPGQGHAPCYSVAQAALEVEQVTLAGRDLLQLTSSRRNLEKSGWAADRVQSVHTPFLSGVAGPFDLVMIFPEIVPGVHWEREIAGGIRGLCPRGARIIVSSKSTYIQRLLEAGKGLTPMRKLRDKGYTAVLLKP